MFNFRQKTNSITTFADLKPGDIFVAANAAHNSYYMKLEYADFINLSNGYYGTWDPDVFVTPIDANCPIDIFVNKTADRTRFSDISYGETFSIDNESFQSYYMKIDTNIPDYNAVNLINGKLCFFDSYQPIQITAIFYEV